MILTKFKELVIEHWIPALVTGLFGVIIGLSVTLFEAGVSDNRFFLEKQAETADRVALQFSAYVENWRRIIALKKFVTTQKRKPTELEKKQLVTYVNNRDTSRDKLFSALGSLYLYFGDEVSNVASEFKQWDELQTIKTITQLPNISSWQTREKEILRAMREELME